MAVAGYPVAAIFLPVLRERIRFIKRALARLGDQRGQILSERA